MINCIISAPVYIHRLSIHQNLNVFIIEPNMPVINERVNVKIFVKNRFKPQKHISKSTDR